MRKSFLYILIIVFAATALYSIILTRTDPGTIRIVLSSILVIGVIYLIYKAIKTKRT